MSRVGMPEGCGPEAISVICTVRNEVRHIEAALRSVLLSSAVEVIVVDDGSTDGTADVLRQLAAADPRVRVIQAADHGRGPALAAAFSASTSPYVMNLDADDLVHPEWVHRGPALLADHPQFHALSPSPRYLDADATMTWTSAPSAMTPRDVTRELAVLNPLVHSGAILRREAVARVGGYDRSLRTHFDYDLWIRLAAAGGRLGRVDARLVCKRLHTGQKFERYGRLAYVWASGRVQARAIRALRAGPWAWCTLVGRLGWGLLPRRMRLGARKRLARVQDERA